MNVPCIQLRYFTFEKRKTIETPHINARVVCLINIGKFFSEFYAFFVLQPRVVNVDGK